MLYTIIIVVALLFVIVNVYMKWNYSYWKRKGIQGPTPIFFFGNIGGLFLNKKTLSETFTNIYAENKHKPYVGIYTILKRRLFVNDLDLIKSILLKDFFHYHDRGIQFDEERDPLLLHLFNLKGETWKNLRNKLTPTFTSSKMKYMFTTVRECNKEMMNYLENLKEPRFWWTRHGNSINLNTKELFACLNTDIIGSCAFGIDCNSFKYPDAEFRTMGRNFVHPGLIRIMQRFLTLFAPWLMKALNSGFMAKKEIKYFYNIVETTINYRRANNIVKNDFLQLLMDLQDETSSGNKPEGKDQQQQDDGTRLTTMQIAAQVFVFFIAGFETSSTTASFALYELALNPDIQDTLRKEIDKVLKEHDGNVTYDALAEMSYLGMVIDETLRKYPPLPVLFRICTKEYTIPGTDIIIEKDTPVMVPVMGIQRDPDIYPNPDKFDPERFTPENKASRHHFAYMPFGEGPRICIGSRFGLMQTKLGLVSILSKYEVSPCEKTLIPMKYDNRSFILAAEGGVWLKLIPRSK